MAKIQILNSLENRLSGSLGDGCAGALCGLQVDKVPTVVAAITHHHKAEGKAQEIKLLNEVLPCGMEPIGVFDCSSEASENTLLSYLAQLPPSPGAEEGEGEESGMEDEPRVAIMKDAATSTLKGFIVVDGALKPAEIEIVKEEFLEKETVLIRVRGKIDLTCGFTKTEISLQFKHLIEKVTCPYGTYTMEGDQVAILHKFMEKQPGKGWADSDKEIKSQIDEDCVIVGPVGENDPVEELWKHCEPVQQDDGFGTQKKKVARKDKLEFNLVWNLTNPACTHRTIGCAPIINYEKKEAKTIRVPICIDALGIVDKRSLIKDLPHVLKGCVARQLGDMAASVLSEMSLRDTVSTPQVHHFRPDGVPHYITIIYPKNSETDSFREFRKNMHVNFMLPLDRPLFRKSNEISWDTKGEKKLENVHEGIVDRHNIPGAVVALVQGRYAYHHYMQDKFHDDGWGCAYRSLQTLISWLRMQGYTEATVPSHKEIQQTLIDIGDKERNFLNSKQWIGSMEVGFVLETRCNIQSRYISVSSGADMASKAEDLIEHFNTQGTPIMIGGGVYAHTILGVAYDEPTDKCSWLILDPHYTGTEDIKTIISKGWCGWKGPNFWNKTAFYNMCLPMRPKQVL